MLMIYLTFWQKLVKLPHSKRLVGNILVLFKVIIQDITVKRANVMCPGDEFCVNIFPSKNALMYYSTC